MPTSRRRPRRVHTELRAARSKVLVYPRIRPPCARYARRIAVDELPAQVLELSVRAAETTGLARKITVPPPAVADSIAMVLACLPSLHVSSFLSVYLCPCVYVALRRCSEDGLRGEEFFTAGESLRC